MDEALACKCGHPENGWNTSKPPHDELVEVWDENEQRVRKAKAVWGRDGVLPHWETEDGWYVEPRGFTKWRREEPLR